MHPTSVCFPESGVNSQPKNGQDTGEKVPLVTWATGLPPSSESWKTLAIIRCDRARPAKVLG
jgi:hypothetical protein